MTEQSGAPEDRTEPTRAENGPDGGAPAPTPREYRERMPEDPHRPTVEPAEDDPDEEGQERFDAG